MIFSRFIRKLTSEKSHSNTVIENELPDAFLLLVTLPRSGSTWLYDSLRCHPLIFVQPTALVWDILDLTGRRYPRGLSNDPFAQARIEVRNGIWDFIPHFGISYDDNILMENSLSQRFAIEKLHPHFFKQQVGKFLRAIESLGNYGEVRLVYQIRDPLETMLSFMSYKDRDPGWNSQLSSNEVPGYLSGLYSTLHELSVKKVGPIVDYDDLRRKYTGTLTKIFNSLWDDHTERPVRQTYELIERIESKTDRNKRKKFSSAFLARKSAELDRKSGTSDHRDILEANTETIEHCYQVYNQLLSRKVDESGEDG